MNRSPQLPTQAEVDRLIALFHAEQYAELEQQARYLAELYPESGRAWKILGTALGVQGKNALAEMQKAAVLLPEDAVVQNNLGNACKDQALYEAAVLSYRRAITLEPEFAEAHNNLGNALKCIGEIDEALACYRTAFRIDPDYADAYINLGNTLLNLRQLDEAIWAYQRALDIDPNDEQLHYQLGGILLELGQLHPAAEVYQRVLSLNPNLAEAHNNLGNVFQAQKQFAAAVASYHKAISLNPRFVEAHNNLGNALLELRQVDAAVNALQQAISLKPDFAEAHGNLGNALHAMGNMDAALISYRRALELNPEHAEAHNNLGTVLLELRQLDEAQQSFRRALQLKPEYLLAYSNLLFVLNYTAQHASAMTLEEARGYGEIITKLVSKRFSTWLCQDKPQQLRIGIISGDFHKHPVGYVLDNIFAQLEQTSIALYAYPTNPKTDELTARLQSFCTAWHPIYGVNDADAARQIHADGIHVLLDLSGHSAHNRLPLFAWKPAPVQVSWLGYFATTGVSEMDYLLTSEVAVPEQLRKHFTEQVWYLPDIWLCFTPPGLDVPVSALPALQKGSLTFACFQRLDKINDVVLSVWGRILAALPQAHLQLASKQFKRPTEIEKFQSRLAQHGIRSAQVSLLNAAATREDYFRRYTQVDMMLDTFPYPGVTTTCEALWMGVPTLTLAGETLVSRQGAGVVVPAGLNDWVANSEAEYIAKAVAFASDLPSLASLRASLRQQALASPVYDAPRFARNFEAALWGMWRETGLEKCKNEPI